MTPGSQPLSFEQMRRSWALVDILTSLKRRANHPPPTAELISRKFDTLPMPALDTLSILVESTMQRRTRSAWPKHGLRHGARRPILPRGHRGRSCVRSCVRQGGLRYHGQGGQRPNEPLTSHGPRAPDRCPAERRSTLPHGFRPTSACYGRSRQGPEEQQGCSPGYPGCGRRRSYRRMEAS